MLAAPADGTPPPERVTPPGIVCGRGRTATEDDLQQVREFGRFLAGEMTPAERRAFLLGETS